MSKIRLLIVLDRPCLSYKNIIDEALLRVAADYEFATNDELTLNWYYVEKDLSSVKWVEYLPGDLGLDYAFVNSYSKSIRAVEGDKYDCIAFVADKVNWKAPEIGGWSLGEFFNGYSIQIIKGVPNQRSLYLTFAMELAHEHDDRYFLKFGKSLDKFFGLDYDEDIIHGKKDPPYKVFEYRPAFTKMKDLLIGMFARTEDYPKLPPSVKEIIQLSLIEKIIVLLNKWFRLLKPSPIRSSDLAGEYHNHKH